MDNEAFWAEARQLQAKGNFSEDQLKALMNKYLNPTVHPKIEDLLKKHPVTAIPQNSVVQLEGLHQNITIREHIGTGESGVVYEVTNSKGQQAALKLPLDKARKIWIHDEVANVERFRAAGIPTPQVLAADPEGAYILSEKVTGPSTVKIIERGLTEDHIKSLAMIYRNGKDYNLALDLKPENLKWDPNQRLFLFVDRGASSASPKKIYDPESWKKMFFVNNPKGEALFQKYLDEYDLSKTPPLDGKVEQMNIWRRAEHGQVEYANKMENRLLETLQTGTNPKIEPIGTGESEPELLTFSDGTKAVRKPAHAAYASARSEVAVYKIDKKLGLNSVPATVIREFNGENYSVQAYVEGASSRVQQGDPSNLRFFDSLLHNPDRHTENYLTVEGRTVAIDHGLSFTSEAPKMKPADQHIDKIVREYQLKLNKEAAKTAIAKHELASFLPEKKVYERLKNTSESEWRNLLSQDLTEDQMKLFLRNRERLIKSVDSAISIVGPDIFRDGPLSGLNFTQPKKLDWDH